MILQISLTEMDIDIICNALLQEYKKVDKKHPVDLFRIVKLQYLMSDFRLLQNTIKESSK